MPESFPPFSERLKASIDAYLERTGMSATEFGQLVMNDTSLYTRIKRGRPINSHTIDQIENLMAAPDSELQQMRERLRAAAKTKS